MHLHAWRVSTFLFSMLIACDDAPPIIPLDGNVAHDGSANHDGSADGSQLDDGGGGDAGMPGCVFDPLMDAAKLASDLDGNDRVIAIAGGVDRFAVAWTELRGGTADLYGAIVPTSGAMPDSTSPLTHNTSLEMTPAIVASGTTWTLVWADNSALNYEIFARTLNADLSLGAMPVRVTTTAALREDSPSILVRPSDFVLSWIEDDSSVFSRVVRVSPLSSAFALTGTAQTLSAPVGRPSPPIISPRSDGSAVGWVDGLSGSADAQIRALDDTATPIATAVLLSSESNADGTLDIDMEETGGAAVFGATVGGSRAEVRFRTIAGDGTVPDVERVITEAPLSGRDASIAHFAGGYAISFRSLPENATDSPTIKVVFVDFTGGVQGSVDLGPTAATGGRTTIRPSADGNLLVAWPTPSDSGGMDIQVARLRCGS